MLTSMAAFAGGLLGSAHCVGMCGGFAAIVGANRESYLSNLWRQLVYGLGRVFTYAFLGMAAGYAGERMADIRMPFLDVQRFLSLIAGAVMILVGATILAPRFAVRILPVGLMAGVVPIFRHFLGARNLWGVFLAGVANGFLPCGLVYAFLMMCMAGGSAPRGLLLMIVFGAGTVPAMTLMGCGSNWIAHRVSLRTRFRLQRIAACIVILTGVVTIERGWPRGPTSCCAEGHAAVLGRPKGRHRFTTAGIGWDRPSVISAITVSPTRRRLDPIHTPSNIAVAIVLPTPQTGTGERSFAYARVNRTTAVRSRKSRSRSNSNHRNNNRRSNKNRRRPDRNPGTRYKGRRLRS